MPYAVEDTGGAQVPVLTLVVRNGAISLKNSRAVSKAVKLHLQWDLASQCFGVYPGQIRANVLKYVGTRKSA